VSYKVVYGTSSSRSRLRLKVSSASITWSGALIDIDAFATTSDNGGQPNLCGDISTAHKFETNQIEEILFLGATFCSLGYALHAIVNITYQINGGNKSQRREGRVVDIRSKKGIDCKRKWSYEL
jgi:hypothetical protein